MNDPSEAQSPLNTIPSANQPALSMRERPARGYLNLRGQPEQADFVDAVRSVVGTAPPVTPNMVTEAEAVSVAWLGPNEWLLVTAPGKQVDLEARLRRALRNLFAAVTDVSSGFTTIEIEGGDARNLLARGCSVDLHPRAFWGGCCARTLLAKSAVTIVLKSSSPVFEIIVRRSYAAYLWRWLDDAARDLRLA